MESIYMCSTQEDDTRCALLFLLSEPPLASRVLGEVPGVNMASILRLPNVGAEPQLLWRFLPVGGGAEADWASNLGATLEAFWPDAHVLRAEPSDQALRLTYEAPTAILRKDRPRVERSVSSEWLGGDSFGAEGLFYTATGRRFRRWSRGFDGFSESWPYQKACSAHWGGFGYGWYHCHYIIHTRNIP